MNISLKPDQEAFIHAKLQSGQYQTVDDVIQAALHLLDEQDKAYEQWVIETREKVDAAAASLDRGEGLDGEEVVSLILEKFRQARETQG
jgi:antitoxin ParD1/3/4